MKTSNYIFPIIFMIGIAACSSSPERRDPPSDRQARGSGQARISGVFVKPIGLLFASMDTNRDAALSGEELVAGIDREWSTFNGNPSAAYFTDWSGKTMGSTDAFPTFLSFDGDLNGVVTELEFSDRLRKEFSDLDENGDGLVTRKEMLVIFDAPQAGQRRGGGEEGGRGQRGGGQRGEGGGRSPR